ncbi:MAG: hypothetical protein WDO74_35720 [Pseudomonadota bacterium]
MQKHPVKKFGSEHDKPAVDSALEAPPGIESIKEGSVPLAVGGSSAAGDDLSLLTDAQLDESLKKLRAEARRRENEREVSRPRAGSKVRILKGRPKYVGKIGTAVIVRRSRCFVAVPEITSPAYVMVSDLELLER